MGWMLPSASKELKGTVRPSGPCNLVIAEGSMKADEASQGTP